MGSVQQVTLGFICLTAAFIFGSYINQHPSLGEPNSLALKDAPAGLDLSLSKKGVEPMPQVRHRVESKASMEDLQALSKRALAITIPDGPKLPSPSELDPRLSLRETSLTSPKSSPLPTPQTASQNAVSAGPDFSNLAASIDGEPQTQDSAVSSMPTVKQPSISNIKNIADSFRKSGASDSQSALTAPDFKDDPFEKIQTPSFESSPASNAANKKENPFNTVAPSLEKNLVTTEQVEPASPGISADSLPTIAAHEPTTSPNVAGMNSVLNQPPAEPKETLPKTDAPTNPSEANAWQNRVVSREPNLIAISPKSDQWSKREASPAVDRTLQETSLQSNESASSPRTKAALPFTLSGDAKIKLVRLRSEAVRKISLETTRFAEHIVLPGDTLQSISTRYLNKPDYYLDIYLANRDRLNNPVEIPQGIVLKVPLYE